MKIQYLILILLCSLSFCRASEPSEQKMKMLYSSLAPQSISQHLAFFELYPNHPLGQKALKEAWLLISPSTPQHFGPIETRNVSTSLANSLVSLINRSPDHALPELSPQTLIALEGLSRQLSHYPLKGHSIWSEQEMLNIPIDQFDVGRGVLLTIYGDDKKKIITYEALLDLMALQISARLPSGASPEMKIRTINNFVFDELEFRFPPHSMYKNQVDIYTFLPSVLDSHRGVCLGVSILYLCLAQRLDLPLEAITPPGHIYIRYHEGDKVINIETTARGIHIDSDDYLNINTKSLEQRNYKEVVGLSHCNHAALLIKNGEYAKALETYNKAANYVPNDPMVNEITGYCYLFLGDKEKAHEYLNRVKGLVPDHVVSKESMAEEYLDGHVDIDGLKMMFTFVDDNRESRLAEKKQLEEILKRCPQFKAGLLHLSSLWMELYRLGEALHVLEKYHNMYPNDPSAEFYLAAIYAERMDYNKAWMHFRIAERLVKAKDHNPKELKELRKELVKRCPE